MRYEFWVGARYAGLGSRRRKVDKGDRFVSFIASSSMVGIALGVAALIVVLSVVNGFQTQVRDKMLSVLPHVELFLRDNAQHQALSRWPEVADQAKQNSYVLGAAPFVSAQGMVLRGNNLRGVQVRGIDPEIEGEVSELPKQMLDDGLAKLEDGTYGIVLGAQLAHTLGVLEGDHVMLMAPQGAVSPAGFSPRMRQFTVVGLYSSGHYEYDSSLVFINVDDAARLFRDNAQSGLRLSIDDMHQAPQRAAELGQQLSAYGVVRDWTQNNKTWFAAVQTEKRMLFLILLLIVTVAAFNLLSSLVMTVKDKQSDIAILRSLGATPRSIAWIFLIQGAIIGVVGTGLGVFLGTLLAFNIETVVPWVERLLGIHFLDPQIYFISTLPSNPQWADIIFIAVVALCLSLLATLYPSWRASKLQPAQVLRHD
ncbi:MAG TPA: lipoprotein-releasing ABC transporter permease subunit [Paenalcaligenes sp.]|nr:lipoprotein-releasing ABC transporter permease subunit [Paenalcaligenes sp.]